MKLFRAVGLGYLDVVSKEFEMTLNRLQLKNLPENSGSGLVSLSPLPGWIPPFLAKGIELRFNSLQKRRKTTGSFTKLYELSMKRLDKVYPVFISPQLKKHWLRLRKISEKQASELGYLLLDIDEKFYYHTEQIDRHKYDLERANSILKSAKKFMADLSLYQVQQKSYSRTYCYNSTEEEIRTLIESAKADIKKIKKELEDIPRNYGEDGLITREYKKDSAAQIFYARSISRMLIKKFNRPMNDCVADFVNTIFGTSYTDNDIIKIVKISSRVTTHL